MKGTVVAVDAFDDVIHVWVSSPLGDSSDAYVLEMRCASGVHAELIAKQWRSAWGITA